MVPNRSSSRRSRDLNPLPVKPAAEAEPPRPAERLAHKNPHAVALGKLGGQKGGRARAAKLSKRRRSEIARRAALTRWQRKALE